MNPWIRRAAVAMAPMVLAKAKQMYDQRQGTTTATSSRGMRGSRGRSVDLRGSKVGSGSGWGRRSH